MKKRITNEELSAFLDGEAQHPDEIERQIGQSEETAGRYRALSKISTHVRSLPALDARPGLSGRVAASLAESKSSRRFVWPLRAAAAVMAGAAFATILVVTDLDENTLPPASEMAVIVPGPVVPVEVTASGNEKDLVAELERRLAAELSPATIVSASYYENPGPLAELPEEILLALAPSDWLETFASLDSTQDYRTQIRSLSETEKSIFVQLLEEYAAVVTPGRSGARKG